MKRKLTNNPSTETKAPPDSYMPYAFNKNIPTSVYSAPRSFNELAKDKKFEGSGQLPNKRNWKKVVKRSLIGLAILALCWIGWVGWKFIYNESKVFGWNGLWSLIHPSPLKNQNGRVNILLAGDSVGRTDGGGGTQLTDSIMIVSVDTNNKTAFLLSVPRDLWVSIPGSGYAKINSAAEDGASNYGNNPDYDKNGMGLLEQVVSADFGIPIDYYALVDYAAFEDAVNAVGGITIDIQSSDPRGLYDSSPVSPGDNQPLVDLSNGIHELNGQQALDLARARGDSPGSYGYASSDFERTSNQRLMLLAIKQKAVSIGVLSNPIKLGNLFDSFGNNVETDMSLGNASKLYSITKNISNANIGSESLNNVNGKDLLTGYYSPDGQDALVPTAGISNFSQIQAFVSQLTGGQ